MAPLVLGISALYHDSAAALVEGDVILAAAQEERFTRRKGDWRFPTAAIDYCLSQLPQGGELAGVAYYENPAVKSQRLVTEALSNAPRGALLWTSTLSSLHALSAELPASLLDLVGDPARIHFTSHHASHAASAFHPSPFTEAAVLVADGVGESVTTSIWSASPEGLVPLREIHYPHSLGLLYSAFTQLCGFRVNSGEYKLMGLAPFGKPKYADTILDNLIDLRPDGSFALDVSFFGFRTTMSTITSRLCHLFSMSGPRHEADPILQQHMDLAASIQAVLEESMLRLARTAIQLTGHQDLCLAGGVALNCVANGRIEREVTGRGRLWTQPAAGDAGGALGAALLVSRSLDSPDGLGRGGPEPTAAGRSGTDAMLGSLLGPEIHRDDIRAALDELGLRYEEPDAAAGGPTLVQAVAAALADGQLVGHVDGRMEYGPRALGNRSILADPRPSTMRAGVNRRIKFREGWRPFAPVVLDEDADALFESASSPYMLTTTRFLDEHFSETGGATRGGPATRLDGVNAAFPAVTHVDGSARVQVMASTDTRRLASILREFRSLTGCPLLLNTSFNVRGEPIVCGARDAIDCFLDTHLDVLAIGPFLVRKADQSPQFAHRVGRRRFDAD